MMAHFANFTGKLSHGIYKMPANHFNLAWSADKVGAMRNQVYVDGPVRAASPTRRSSSTSATAAPSTSRCR